MTHPDDERGERGSLPRANLTNHDFTWAPRYLTSTSDSTYPAASFSTNETAALALVNTGLPLDAQGVPTSDNYDQLDVTYDPSFDRWLMIQGGDNPDSFLWAAALGPQNVKRDTLNSISVRDSAGHLPWTWNAATTRVLNAGNPAWNVAPAAGTMYAAGGILHHDSCVPSGSTTCTADTAGTTNIEVACGSANAKEGRLYGAHFINPWIYGDQAAGVNRHYFTVSTWNPYGAFLGRITYKNP